MGRKGRWKGADGEGERSKVVTEATRIRISQCLEEFRSSESEVYTFEADLSKFDRAVVHELCKKMGMISKSSGYGDRRRLSVFKRKKKQSSMQQEQNLKSLKFAEPTRLILQDFFIRYPPDSNPRENNPTENSSQKKSHVKRDKSFSKPSFSEEEISKRLSAFAEKVENDPPLKKIMEARSRLPIAAFKDVITSTVESNQVVLISGETGCGKTTQVPQFLLESMWREGKSCKIMCTQPRRLSAMSVAERIAYERGETVGENIGYKIRLESKGGKDSSIMFCTNGILLRVLISSSADLSQSRSTSKSKSKAKSEYLTGHSRDRISRITHIIVDEIHERDRFSDFMLAIIRDMLPFCPHLRLILMSATIDADRFSQYFGGCPVIQVPGFTFPVKTFYLEDVLSILHSTDDNHLDLELVSEHEDGFELDEDYKTCLEESIDLAQFSDEFEPLMDLVSSNPKSSLVNYQHSTTGMSPLMVVAAGGRVNDVCTLLSLGVDFSLRSKDGKNGLDWAQQNNHGEVSGIIEEHMQKSNRGLTERRDLLDKYLEKANPELIDTHLILSLLRKICIDSAEGAILVFLPGWDDINQTRERLLACPNFKDPKKFLILSLHSMIPSSEQKKVFKRASPGARKIVLSTNIAETAITIDDVVFVIDSGRMKEKSYDPYNNVSTLYSSWVSKASARQREGRAGRCQPGICYHLFSRARAASLPDHQVPEIKRMPIEEVCLQVKLLDANCNIMDFLQKIMDPPVSAAISNGILVLQDIGALTPEENLTELGERLSSLPVHPSISKMLLFAILMHCLDPALTLACAADYREPFVLPLSPIERKKAETAKSKLSSFYGGFSDHLTIIAAYDFWRRAKDRGLDGKFCSMFYVSSATMNMIHGMRRQLEGELMKNGFISDDDLSRCSLNSQRPGILRAVLTAGAYPLVGKLFLPQQGPKRAVVEIVNGAKAALHPHSSNFKLTLSKSTEEKLLIYDEITRGEGRMFIRNSTMISPFPLLLVATEIAVAPLNEDRKIQDEGAMEISSASEDDGDDGDDAKMAVKAPKEDKIMSSPENAISLVIDRWLMFESTAIDAAQIYCLREHLAAAILFKVKRPREPLPPMLEAAVHTIACILSQEGGIDVPPETAAAKGNNDPRAAGVRMVEGAMVNFLKSLLADTYGSSSDNGGSGRGRPHSHNLARGFVPKNLGSSKRQREGGI